MKRGKERKAEREGGFRGCWTGKGWELERRGTYLSRHRWETESERGGGCPAHGRLAEEKRGSSSSSLGRRAVCTQHPGQLAPVCQSERVQEAVAVMGWVSPSAKRVELEPHIGPCSSPAIICAPLSGRLPRELGPPWRQRSCCGTAFWARRKPEQQELASPVRTISRNHGLQVWAMALGRLIRKKNVIDLWRITCSLDAASV